MLGAYFDSRIASGKVYIGGLRGIVLMSWDVRMMMMGHPDFGSVDGFIFRNELPNCTQVTLQQEQLQ